MNKSSISDSFFRMKLELLKSIVPLTFENKWKLASHRNDIKIHLKLDEKSGLYFVRAEASVEASMSKIIELLKDNDRVTSYDSTIELLKILEEKDNHWVVYTLSKKPSLIIDKRDCVTLTKFQQENDGTCIFVGGSIPHPDYPVKQSPVRCEIPLWGWILTPRNGNTTNLIYIVLVDPKGSVPKSMINTFYKDQAMSVRNVRNIVEDKKNPKKIIKPKL